MSRWRKRLVWLLLPFTLIVLDQVTKELVRSNLARGEEIEVIEGFFRLTHVQNKGAAFGIFSELEEGFREILLTTLRGIALILVVIYSLRLRPEDLLSQTGLHFIFGGAIGNLIDSFSVGWVTDFLELYWGDFHWPAFNVADSVIVLGVALLLIDTFRPHRKTEKAGRQLSTDDGLRIEDAMSEGKPAMVADAEKMVVEEADSDAT